MSLVDILLIVLLPPLAIYLKKGVGMDLYINIALCIFTVWVGAIIHALYVYTQQGGGEG